ncbi:hypothetical protein BKA69DRAFT_582325 [Paraphysoderma sedebokerense]|nr:hypothetical protein BKA69DRAFT_582325 [Paraphysoderma sedebokerense]
MLPAVLLATILLFSSVSANSSGSPICSVDEAAIARGMGGSNSNLGYSIAVKGNTTTYSNTPLEIAIQGTAAYGGLVLFVENASGNKVGTWKFPSGLFQKLSSCEGVTHTNQLVSTKNQITAPPKFTWTPSGDSSGPLSIKAVVVQGPRNRWQVLQPYKLGKFTLTSYAATGSIGALSSYAYNLILTCYPNLAADANAPKGTGSTSNNPNSAAQSMGHGSLGLGSIAAVGLAGLAFM